MGIGSLSFSFVQLKQPLFILVYTSTHAYILELLIRCRSNRYDGQLEYWVVIKETAEHTESQTMEETTRQNKQASYFNPCISPERMVEDTSDIKLSGYVATRQVSEKDMPEIDPKTFDGINAHLERSSKAEAIDLPNSASAEVEAPLLYIIYMDYMFS